MRSLSAWSLLFAGLILAPAGILGWLGLQSTTRFEENARAIARRDARRHAADVRERVAARLKRFAADFDDAVVAAAADLRATLPRLEGGVALRSARQVLLDRLGLHRACVEIRQRDGTTYLPCALRQPRRGPEWERFTSARDRATRLAQTTDGVHEAAVAFERIARSLATPRLRALALAHAVRVSESADPQLAARLRDELFGLATSAVVAAGPLSVEVVAAHPNGAKWLERAVALGLLAQVPATAAARADWHARAASIELPSIRLAAQLESEGDAGFSRRDTELRFGMRLAVAISVRDVVAALFSPAVVDGVETTFGVAANSEPEGIVERGDSFASVVRHGKIAVRASVRSRVFATLARDAARRRGWTLAGICALVASMGVGLFLVRRTLLQERAARRLREDFIANVSHDLRTPLTSIRMHAEMLANDDLDTSTRRRYGAVVEAEGARLGALVEDMLDFAALERGTRRLELAPIDLKQAAASVVTAWQPMARREGVALSCVGDSVASAMADPTALSRILSNLLQNAWKHGRPPCGEVVPEIRVEVRGSSIRVGDNGPGIVASDRERVFERFQQGPSGSRRGGVGIGLALARDLARAMGGDLRVCDDTTRATTFCLDLVPPDEADVLEAM